MMAFLFNINIMASKKNEKNKNIKELFFLRLIAPKIKTNNTGKKTTAEINIYMPFMLYTL